jgi:hypothetical protein
MPPAVIIATFTLTWAVVSGFGAVAITSHARQQRVGTEGSEVARSFADLRAQVPQMTAPAALNLRFRWLTDDPVENPASTVNRFQLVSVERVRTRVSRDRSPQVSSVSLVVISHDSSGKELDWRIVPDPRVVRSESGTAPVLNGQSLYYLDADLRLVIADLPDLARLSLYKVRPQGGAAVLDPVGTIDLPRP